MSLSLGPFHITFSQQDAAASLPVCDASTWMQCEVCPEQQTGMQECNCSTAVYRQLYICAKLAEHPSHSCHGQSVGRVQSNLRQGAMKYLQEPCSGTAGQPAWSPSDAAAGLCYPHPSLPPPNPPLPPSAHIGPRHILHNQNSCDFITGALGRHWPACFCPDWCMLQVSLKYGPTLWSGSLEYAAPSRMAHRV